ncbi:MAG: hypothetical protein KL839_04830 [Rhizobium sp.]|nr:hypothetical protein [Rhizobium sp.]
MTAVLSLILRILSPAGVAAVLALLFWEGIPFVNQIPFLDRIPIVREFGVGRVELERRKAVEGLVKQSELDALSAVLEQERAKASAAEAMATEARNRAAALLQLKETQRAEIDRLTELAKGTLGLSYPTEEDLTWKGSR